MVKANVKKYIYAINNKKELIKNEEKKKKKKLKINWIEIKGEKYY